VRVTRLVALDDALARLRTDVSSLSEIRRCLSGHRLDWMRLDGAELTLSDMGAAREARLLVQEDGLTLQEVAGRAGAVLHQRAVYLQDLPQEAATVFAAAAPGEVVGPWQEDEQWRVLVLDDKTPPSPDDGELSRRAADELLQDVLDRHQAGRCERLCVL
jgi:hypothetical protein